MLVLCRRLLESVYLDAPPHGRVAVTVVEVGRGRVRLGVEAPAGVVVMRAELVDGPRREGGRP